MAATPATSNYAASSNADSVAKMAASQLSDASRDGQAARKFKPDSRFALVFVSICVCTFLSALDFTAVATVLPSISSHFNSGEGAFVGSAYALTSTALVPVYGSLANIFGRRATLAASIILFALGSALCGAAPSMTTVIAARAIQGAGGAGLSCLAQIIVVDLVPLAERGTYIGFLAAVWAVASSLGPPVAGALGSAGAWRWLWYLNLPICAVAFVLCIFFLDIKTPKRTWRENVAMMNWNNVTFIASATGLILGLTWGGTTYAWSSWRVILCLVLGLGGIAAFLVIEKVFVKDPTVPFDILTERTAFWGFVNAMLVNMVVVASVYYLPVYFQAVKGSSPIRSGVQTFTLSFTIAPLAAISGVSVRKTGRYRLQNILAYVLMTIGFGLMTRLVWDASDGAWIGFPTIVGCGAGIAFGAFNFPVLAPIKLDQQPHAISFLTFMRQLGGVLGISVGATILQNGLTSDLPFELTSRFGHSTEIAWAAIPFIKHIQEPAQTIAKRAFADAIIRIWVVCCALSGAGFVACCLMQDLPLHTTTDENWGLAENDDTTTSTSATNLEKSLPPTPSAEESDFVAIEMDQLPVIEEVPTTPEAQPDGDKISAREKQTALASDTRDDTQSQSASASDNEGDERTVSEASIIPSGPSEAAADEKADTAIIEAQVHTADPTAADEKEQLSIEEDRLSDDCSTDDARTATENDHAQGGDNASLSSLSVYTSPTGEATDAEGQEKEPEETVVPLSGGSESDSKPAAKSS